MRMFQLHTVLHLKRTTITTQTHLTTPTAGTGTEADPFNVAAALKYIDAGQNLDKDVYVSGTIVSVKEIDAANYGNATLSYL